MSPVSAFHAEGPDAPAHSLVVLRHAKSDWPAGYSDAERPVGARGRRDAGAVGRWIAENVGAPDHVVCSPARRTEETWEIAAAELGSEPEVTYDDRIYEGSRDDLLEVIRALPESDATVVLVGHNPGVQELVLALADVGDDNVRALAASKYPTAALAVLRLDGEWATAGAKKARAELSSFVVPRG
jgi:phosphohistidine phosphatase